MKVRFSSDNEGYQEAKSFLEETNRVDDYLEWFSPKRVYTVIRFANFWHSMDNAHYLYTEVGKIEATTYLKTIDRFDDYQKEGFEDREGYSIVTYANSIYNDYQGIHRV